MIFTVRRYASAVYAVIMCSSVCLSVSSQSYTKVVKPKMTQTMRYNTQFSDAKDIGEILMGSPPTGATNGCGVDSDRRFLTNISIYLRNCARCY